MEILERSVESMEEKHVRDCSGLFSAYYDKVYNLCSRICLNRAEAQDITQETFIKVFRSLGSFKGQSHISTWIYSIAVRQCFDHMRSEKRIYDKAVRLTGFGKREDRNLEDKVVTKHLGSQILSRLSPRNRTLLILKAYMGLNYDEIAAALGSTPASVGVQLCRARREALKIAEREGMIDDELQGF
ncbi:MAG: RNA polymerase sigma factor [Vulcanimicrobiota bacterium]